MSVESSEGESETEHPAARATELASELGEVITELPAYQEFMDAKEAVESDEEIQEQVREFEQLREEFMLARQTGDATNEDLRELQEAQQELNDIPEMAEFQAAQNRLELSLQELNETISEPLTVDFGGKAGGCCED
ncbi:YlbF family regulator [Haloglomus litoreum]|uniref:YlbF family regulator n=1 Tax=Haloglomus litoreum TaxID=3034026 RepID=UPI0023E8C697|nr:YlbF family regulator [Haloglomus sp. DT116]